MPKKIGLNDEEKYILDCLANAWNAFIQLPDKHMNHNNEFRDAIHRAQSLIAMQVARRANPEIWWVPAEHLENS
jgi:hypothetical protein